VPVNQGVVPPSSWCWRIWKLVLPMNVFLIYIRKHSVVFSHLGFHINLVYCVFDVILLNCTAYGYMLMIY
jgi:hypothetical protein